MKLYFFLVLISGPFLFFLLGCDNVEYHVDKTIFEIQNLTVDTVLQDLCDKLGTNKNANSRGIINSSLKGHKILDQFANITLLVNVDSNETQSSQTRKRVGIPIKLAGKYIKKDEVLKDTNPANITIHQSSSQPNNWQVNNVRINAEIGSLDSMSESSSYQHEKNDKILDSIDLPKEMYLEIVAWNQNEIKCKEPGISCQEPVKNSHSKLSKNFATPYFSEVLDPGNNNESAPYQNIYFKSKIIYNLKTSILKGGKHDKIIKYGNYLHVKMLAN